MPTKRKTTKAKIPVKKIKGLGYNVPLYAGLGLITISVVLLLLMFFPVLKSELVYKFAKPDSNVGVSLSKKNVVAAENKSIIAKDKDFSVVIPKIGANARVIPNVDPLNSHEYQVALTKGVAHAKGTAFPDEVGNTFLFAHSSDSIFTANTYNAVFYLLNKMQTDDIFYIAYKEKLFKYKVVKTEIVAPSAVGYYSTSTPYAVSTATLMTCWPPATTLRRLVVVGVLL